jgi:hypothetical protein
MRTDWTREELKELLIKSDHAVCKALVAIWNFQELDEKGGGTSHHQNKVGFTGVDAGICTSLVDFYQKTGFLTPKQMIIARKKALKYTRQLQKIANKEYETEAFIRAL